MRRNMEGEGLSVGHVASITQETLKDYDKNYLGIRVHLTINITKQTRGQLFSLTWMLPAMEEKEKMWDRGTMKDAPVTTYL